MASRRPDFRCRPGGCEAFRHHPGQVWAYDLFAVPAGAPHAKEALEFIKFATSTQPLAASVSWISYGPVRASSIPMVGKLWKTGVDMKSFMPTSPENFKDALAEDIQFWADHQDGNSPPSAPSTTR